MNVSGFDTADLTSAYDNDFVIRSRVRRLPPDFKCRQPLYRGEMVGLKDRKRKGLGMSNESTRQGSHQA